MSRTRKDRPTRLREAEGEPLAYWSTRLNDWVLPASVLMAHAPRWYRHSEWHSPERNRERDDLRRLARTYNTTGDTDDDFPNHQHHHRSNCHWW